MLYKVTLSPAYHDVFLEMAAQGQTVFAAAGDAGAFGVNRNEDGYYWVFPGGTTLPITGMDLNALPSFSVSLAREQPWSLSYLLASRFAQNGNLAQTVALLKLAFPEGAVAA